MSIKLSIITICYNEKDVENTCLSIINQTWRNFEWIVIDGGSDAWCTDILEKYRGHMVFYVSEKDGGRYEAMNKGISHANGEYLLFMNAGDSLYDDTVLYDVWAKNEYSADIIYGNEKVVTEDGSYFTFAGEKKFRDKYFWMFNFTLRHQASCIKKTLFDTYGIYNTEYRSASDFEKFLLFIYTKKCSVQFIDRFISIFKQFDGISSSAKHIGQLEVYRISCLVFGTYAYRNAHYKAACAKCIANILVFPVLQKTRKRALRHSIFSFLINETYITAPVDFKQLTAKIKSIHR